MRFALLPVLLLVLASPLAAETPAADLEIYQWLDTLDYPFTRETPWVTVTRSHPQQPGQPPLVYETRGFLIRESETEITLLTAQLLQAPIQIGTAKVERQDLAAEVRSRLAKLDERKRNLDFGLQLPDRASLVVLARALHQRGDEALAAQVMAEASQLSASHRQGSNDATFAVRLKEDFAMAEIWRGICAFGGNETGWGMADGSPLPPWEDLLKRMERIVRLYPGTKHHERAQKTAESLRRLIAENQAHRPPADLGLLSTRERVAELIFQLREQNGRQFMQPGGCDVFHTREDSPAHRLVEIGYEAVPQLIEALDSDTLTRSIGFHRDFYFSHKVLTVGDCADQILYRISGRQFRPPSGTPEEQLAAAQKQAVAAWWEPFKNMSEKEILVAEISSGTVYPFQLVTRLQKKHPEAVTEAVLAGSQKALQTTEGEYWITHLADLNDPRAGFALSDIMRSKGRPFATRLRAAQAAHRLGNAAALPLMIEAWEQRTGNRFENSPDFPFHELTRFLAESGDLRAIRAFDTHMPRLGVRARKTVVGDLRHWANPQNAKAHPEVAQAVEALLASCLEDVKCDPNSSLGFENGSISGPETRFVALRSLSSLAPERYEFEISASPGALEVAYLKARNAWRAQQGQPALPVPADDRPVLPAESADTITKIEVLPAGAAVSRGFRAVLDQQLQKPLRPESLFSVGDGFVRSPSPGFGGLELMAYHDGDGKGVTLRAAVLKGSNDADKGWEVWVGTHLNAWHMATSNFSLETQVPDLSQAKDAMNEALKTRKGNEPVKLRLGILSRDNKW